MTSASNLLPADWQLRQACDAQLPHHTLATSRGEHAVIQIGDLQDPQVLFVPGFTGSKEDFAPILRPLAAAGFRVSAIDQRGQYQSPGVRAGAESEADYSVAELGADLIAVVESLGAPMHVIGHSFGGLVTRDAVIARPELFTSFLLMDTGPTGVDEVQRERLELLRPVLTTYGIEAAYQGMEMLNAAEEGYEPPPPPLKEFLHIRFVSSSTVGLLGMGEALTQEPDRVAELGATGVRMAVLHGRDEDVWLPPVQEEMAQRLGVEKIVIADAAHSPAADNPSETLSALVSFLRG